jgi:predicted ArsR family transcriptional regulator
MSASERRIVNFLKVHGPQTTAAVARHLAITLPGARKHLEALSAARLIAFNDERRGVGRPGRHWRLTEKAEERFPDTHAAVTIEMIDAIRESFGEAGLDRIIAHREGRAEGRYDAALAGCRDLGAKIERLAALRSAEGYMAECQALPDGSFLLIENHCPICAAARHCQGFCRSELSVFRHLLADSGTIEREDHILAGARRCAYRVTPLKVATP